MNTQPEALRLINNRHHAHLISWQANVCVELRRLYEENQRLKKCLFQMQNAAVALVESEK